jgi:hypothetical protein
MDNQTRPKNSEGTSRHSQTQSNDFHEESSESNIARQQLLVGAADYSPVQVTLSKHSEQATINAHLEAQQLMLTMSTTSEDFAFEVKSALAWTFAVLQPHKGDMEGLFNVSLDQRSEIWMPSISKFNPTRTESYCWMSLFRYACIAPFPSTKSLYDSAREGLEIDLDLLLMLASVDREMATDDGIILFGFDTALIPLEPPESKRWHFLTTDGKQITPMRISKVLNGLKLRAQGKMSNYYSTGKVYVGWCGNPVVKIGTAELDLDLVEDALMASGVPDVKKLEERSEKTSSMDVSLLSRKGFLGSALGISGGTKRETKFRQVAVVAKRTQAENFERVLDAACATPCILWDNSILRAWLLPAVSVLLFASLQYVEWKRYTFRRKGADGHFERATVHYAQLSADAKRAALSCLRQNKTLQVDEADGHVVGEDISFEDIVRDIWLGMSIGEDECSSEITGRRYETVNSLLGYDLKEAICGTRIHLRTLKVMGSMESWKPLAHVKQPQVIFYRRVGPVITCGSSACSSACCEQNSTQGVLSCLLQDLKVFYGESWDKQSKLQSFPLNLLRLPIGDDFEWIPSGPEAFTHYDKSCRMEGLPCACCEKLERLQSITEKKVKLQKKRFKRSLQLDTIGQVGSNQFSLPNSPSALRFGSVCT